MCGVGWVLPKANRFETTESGRIWRGRLNPPAPREAEGTGGTGLVCGLAGRAMLAGRVMAGIGSKVAEKGGRLLAGTPVDNCGISLMEDGRVWLAGCLLPEGG